jgi:chitin disaccharide deacetylase
MTDRTTVHDVNPLNVRLGFGESSRVVIVAADGLGMSHASTEGVYDCLRAGLATTGRLMVPAPWSRAAAAQFRGEDIGVSLTATAEYDRYRWGPITRGPSLVDGNGGFPATAPDFWDHADLSEARTEFRAQIERAIWWGFDVSHLDSHRDTLHLRPEFFDLELELAIEFQIPLRLPSVLDETRAGFPLRRLAAEEGVLTPDYVIDLVRSPNSDSRSTLNEFEAIINNVSPGVTEVRLRPALDTPELRALHDGAGWVNQVDHHRALLDASLRATIARSGIELVGYRELRKAQRATHTSG